MALKSGVAASRGVRCKVTGLNGLSGDFVVPVRAVVEAAKGEFDVCQIAFHGVEVKWAFWIHECQRRRGSGGDAKEAV
ncbi:MAG: hypothetical protein RL114_1015 [Actinomycetota bacterium]